MRRSAAGERPSRRRSELGKLVGGRHTKTVTSSEGCERI